MAIEGLAGSGISYQEFGIRDGSSPNETFEFDGVTAQRKFRVAWTDRKEAAIAILGYPYVDGCRLRRYMPEVHPEAPWLVATRVSMKGIGWRGVDTFSSVDPNVYIPVVNQPVNRFEYAELTVDFGYTEYDVIGDEYMETQELEEHRRFVIERPRQSSSYLSFPQGTLVWSPGAPNAGKTVVGSTGKIEVFRDYNLEWVQVPEEAVPFDRLDEFCGKVNKTTFRGKEPGTLLLKSADYELRRHPYGVRLYNVPFVMKYFVHGWNNIYDFRGSPPGYNSVEKDGWVDPGGGDTDNKYVYDERDFSLLFKPTDCE